MKSYIVSGTAMLNCKNAAETMIKRKKT